MLPLDHNVEKSSPLGKLREKPILLVLIVFAVVVLFLYAYTVILNKQKHVDVGSALEADSAGEEKCGLTPPKNGKLTREEAGRTTWRFMHMMAHQLKNEPAEVERMVNLVYSVSALFPCATCAKDFRRELASHPWDAKRYKHPKYWICKLHNVVNIKLNKPLFTCDDSHLDEEYAMPSCY